MNEPAVLLCCGPLNVTAERANSEWSAQVNCPIKCGERLPEVCLYWTGCVWWAGGWWYLCCVVHSC